MLPAAAAPSVGVQRRPADDSDAEGAETQCSDDDESPLFGNVALQRDLVNALLSTSSPAASASSPQPPRRAPVYYNVSFDAETMLGPQRDAVVVVLDLECTSTHIFRARIIELAFRAFYLSLNDASLSAAAAHVDFCTLVWTPRAIPREVSQLTGLQRKQFRSAPPLRDALEQLFERLATLRTELLPKHLPPPSSALERVPLLLVAHNGWRYDFSVLCAEAERVGQLARFEDADLQPLYVCDSLYYALALRRVQPQLAALSSFALGSLHQALCVAASTSSSSAPASSSSQTVVRHRAHADACSVWQLLQHPAMHPRLHRAAFLKCLRPFSAALQAYSERRKKYLDERHHRHGTGTILIPSSTSSARSSALAGFSDRDLELERRHRRRCAADLARARSRARVAAARDTADCRRRVDALRAGLRGSGVSAQALLALAAAAVDYEALAAAAASPTALDAMLADAALSDAAQRAIRRHFLACGGRAGTVRAETERDDPAGDDPAGDDEERRDDEEDVDDDDEEEEDMSSTSLETRRQI